MISAYLTVSASPILPVPLPIYMICTYTGNSSAEIAFITMTLVYGAEFPLPFIDHLGDTRPDHPADVLAFSVIVYLVVWSNVNHFPIPSLFETIARDATRYFLIIFASHLVVVMFLAFASVSTSL